MPPRRPLRRPSHTTCSRVARPHAPTAIAELQPIHRFAPAHGALVGRVSAYRRSPQRLLTSLAAFGPLARRQRALREVESAPVQSIASGRRCAECGGLRLHSHVHIVKLQASDEDPGARRAIDPLPAVVSTKTRCCEPPNSPSGADDFRDVALADAARGRSRSISRERRAVLRREPSSARSPRLPASA